MSTQQETVDFILNKLRDRKRFSARAMFGEYALYADGHVVALICDDRLYVKILPASAGLEDRCEKGDPYPGAKPHFLIDEGQLSTMPDLPQILFAIGESRAKDPRAKNRKASTVSGPRTTGRARRGKSRRLKQKGCDRLVAE
jgi:hypothetical protein